MTMLLRTATTFDSAGRFDEEAFRAHLERFVDARLGVYLASGGSGEGHALTPEELARVYSVGVDVCKGKVPVHANQPDQLTARETIEHARIAVDAGVDMLNIYGPENRHSYRANDAEYVAYFERVLAEINHPVALAPNASVSYVPPPSVIAAIANSHPQVQAINLVFLPETYFIDLRDALDQDLEIYVHWAGSLGQLVLGASGLLGAEANFIPKTFRRFIDLYETRDFSALADVYEDLLRVARFLREWPGSGTGTTRWLKTAMRAFDLPGAAGGVREPHLMPDDAAVADFARGSLALNVDEITELGRIAGLID
jgi:4-hydroxy-tetrahydrodipicolinate synthase